MVQFKVTLSRRAFLLGGLRPAGPVRRIGHGSIGQLVVSGPAIRDRDEWAVDRAARGDLEGEDVRFLIIHHSASSNDYAAGDVPAILRGFFDYHTSEEKGWNDIAYNFLIDRFGGIWEGRTGSASGPVAGDATGGNQGFSQLICLLGDFSNEPPSSEAMSSLVLTLAWLADRYQVSTAPGAEVAFTSRGSNRWAEGEEVTTSTLAGHRDMSLTTCPGDELYASLVSGQMAKDVERIREPAPATSTTGQVPQQPRTTNATSTSTSLPSETPSTTAVASTTNSAGAPLPDSTDIEQEWIRGLSLLAAGIVVGLVIRRRMTNAKN